ncbi:hypothetical protein DERP_011238 [Dermatophagoides pteronyssinus]|uniref:Uncharacterized protein n=1 Tax=Dermatophagoides pteronyssinus TaxID=6956 RepID=A0ABQ8JCJ4_DERPT|nr:hypothetical protein DERP_011238 [Dermatophagoides pteronyssinus]
MKKLFKKLFFISFRPHILLKCLSGMFLFLHVILIYGLQLNEIIQIICEIDSRPNTDITFQWRFEKHTNLANFIVINKTKNQQRRR